MIHIYQQDNETEQYTGRECLHMKRGNLRDKCNEEDLAQKDNDELLCASSEDQSLLRSSRIQIRAYRPSKHVVLIGVGTEDRLSILSAAVDAEYAVPQKENMYAMYHARDSYEKKAGYLIIHERAAFAGQLHRTDFASRTIITIFPYPDISFTYPLVDLIVSPKEKRTSLVNNTRTLIFSSSGPLGALGVEFEVESFCFCLCVFIIPQR